MPQVIKKHKKLPHYVSAQQFKFTRKASGTENYAIQSLFHFIFCFQTKSFNGKILENKLKIHKIYIGKSPFTFFGTQFKCIYADETNWKRVLVRRTSRAISGRNN